MRQVRRTLLVASAALAAVVTLVAGAGAATAPKTGVVVIETALRYQQTSAAGTGVVLSRTGVVLTNNHVIRGATRIRVATTGGRRYTARVLGYSMANDVAVLKLESATGLATATLGRSAGVRRGHRVIAVGNAEGAGMLVVSRGNVVATGRTITVRGVQGEKHQLTGLIQTNAELHPGESGGPLLDVSGRVIGINTAASTGWDFHAGSREGFAIPIDRAMAIAGQIQAGRESPTVHVGPTAFLGIAVHASGYYDDGYRRGVRVDNVLEGGAADRAGLERGDIITTIAGRRVATPADVARIVARYHPGDAIRLTWIDDSGKRSSGRVRLATGPPQ